MSYRRYDLGMDAHLEEMYEVRYLGEDYNVFEENQLMLDGEYDDCFDDVVDDFYYDSLEYDDPL